jgi:hypothetical protein
MRKFFILILLIATFISSCDGDDISDPTLGEWIIVLEKSNGSDIELSSCRLQSTITIEKERIYFNNYFIDEDTENCENSMRSERIKRGSNNFMTIDRASVFNQNLRLELKGDQIWYSFDGWDLFNPNGATSTRIDLIYEKKFND